MATKNVYIYIADVIEKVVSHFLPHFSMHSYGIFKRIDGDEFFIFVFRKCVYITGQSLSCVFFNVELK